jgi:phosphatidylinositol dimannoside acyltransferase
VPGQNAPDDSRTVNWPLTCMAYREVMMAGYEMLSDISRLPLKVRRRALRVLWRASRVTGKLPVYGLEEILRYVLHLSNSEAARIDKEIVYQDMIARAEWGAVLKRSWQGLESDSASIHFPERGVLEQASRSGKPVIFTPIHMGCYVLPFARIMLDHFENRRMLILRAREDRPDETLAMQRISEIGIDMRFLNVNEKQKYLEAVRFAKDGAVIVSFADLPASYGGPERVTLFGKPIQLAMGVASLARLTGATVIPMAVHSSVEGDIVDIGRPFESYQKGPAEKARIASILRRHIEDSVRETPEQWHMWPRFNEFLDTEMLGEAV